MAPDCAATATQRDDNPLLRKLLGGMSIFTLLMTFRRS